MKLEARDLLGVPRTALPAYPLGDDPTVRAEVQQVIIPELETRLKAKCETALRAFRTWKGDSIKLCEPGYEVQRDVLRGNVCRS